MTGICGLAVRAGGTAEGLPAMLDALADYGATAGRRRADAAALGAVGPEGTAPLVDSRGLTIAADARLDDPAQLREALGLTPRDGEVANSALILHAYLRWGRACVERLYGDFAFVVWDAPRRRLFCARDALGARPFYYALNARRFAFATALESVLAAPGVGAEIDERRVSAHLASPWRSFRRRTFFREVLRLAAGHTLTVDVGRLRPVRQRRWWRPEGLPTARGGSAEEHGEGLLGELDRAVRVRLGGGPVGVGAFGRPGLLRGGGAGGAGAAPPGPRPAARLHVASAAPGADAAGVGGGIPAPPLGGGAGGPAVVLPNTGAGRFPSGSVQGHLPSRWEHRLPGVVGGW